MSCNYRKEPSHLDTDKLFDLADTNGFPKGLGRNVGICGESVSESLV